MKTNLLIIQLKKEKKHWQRTGQTLNRFKSWGSKYTFGLLIVTIGSILHYCFALMSTLWSCGLFIFARDMYKNNLNKMALTVKNVA